MTLLINHTVFQYLIHPWKIRRIDGRPIGKAAWPGRLKIGRPTCDLDSQGNPARHLPGDLRGVICRSRRILNRSLPRLVNLTVKSIESAHLIFRDLALEMP